MKPEAIIELGGKVFDMLLLSVLWLLCCVPVVTIGPATAALYYAVVKAVRRDTGSAAAEFFGCFRRNFRQGARLTLALGAYGLMTWLMARSANILAKNVPVFGFYKYVGPLFYIPLIAVLPYVFPLLSRFTQSEWGFVKASLYMGFRYIYLTLPILAIMLAAGCIGVLVPPLLLILPALCCLLCSLHIEPVFKKLTPPPGTPDDAHPAPWYWE